MPSWVTEHSQPDRKLGTLAKRISRLQGALKASESPIHVANAAEKVRLATLAVIKAKLALIREYPRRDPDGRQTEKLLAEDQRWRSLSVEAIVELHGKCDT